jgi:hypothetical protein
MYVEITSDGIKVTATDGIGSSQPTNLNPVSDEKGNVSYYQRFTNKDQRAEHWLQRLGKALADYLRRYGKMKIPKGKYNILTRWIHRSDIYSFI